MQVPGRADPVGSGQPLPAPEAGGRRPVCDDVRGPEGRRGLCPGPPGGSPRGSPRPHVRHHHHRHDLLDCLRSGHF